MRCLIESADIRDALTDWPQVVTRKGDQKGGLDNATQTIHWLLSIEFLNGLSADQYCNW